jgi:hypothetical protein
VAVDGILRSSSEKGRVGWLSISMICMTNTTGAERRYGKYRIISLPVDPTPGSVSTVRGLLVPTASEPAFLSSNVCREIQILTVPANFHKEDAI